VFKATIRAICVLKIFSKNAGPVFRCKIGSFPYLGSLVGLCESWLKTTSGDVLFSLWSDDFHLYRSYQDDGSLFGPIMVD
jgi:hypothetical protein